MRAHRAMSEVKETVKASRDNNEESGLIAERRRKLTELRQGGNAYPMRFLLNVCLYLFHPPTIKPLLPASSTPWIRRLSGRGRRRRGQKK